MDNSTIENTVIHFHVGRGGRFWNPGHITFQGYETLADFNRKRDLGLFYPKLQLYKLAWDKNGMSPVSWELEPEDYDAISTYYDNISKALANEVAEQYGETYGKAFRGNVNNADGIWFDDLEVDPDTFAEIRSLCEDLVSDEDWRKSVDAQSFIDNMDSNAEMTDDCGNPVSLTIKQYHDGIDGIIDHDGPYDTDIFRLPKDLTEEECQILIDSAKDNKFFADIARQVVSLAGFDNLLE